MKSLSSALLCLITLLPAASGVDFEYAGLRFGVDDEASYNIQSYEVFATFDTPWEWNLSEQWSLDILLETSVGALHGEGDVASMFHLGFLAALNHSSFPLSFIVSTGPTYLTDTELDNHDLGTALQFTSALGLDYHCCDKWTLGYRYQHISNGGVKSPNPGLDMHVFAASYHF